MRVARKIFTKRKSESSCENNMWDCRLYLSNISLVHLRLIVLSLGLLSLSACSSIEPWVKPYERANLADPIMNFTPNPVSNSYVNHVYQARESMRGAESGSGGGCGCN